MTNATRVNMPTIAALTAPGQPWDTHIQAAEVAREEVITVQPGGYLYAIELALLEAEGRTIFRVDDEARCSILYGQTVEWSMLPLARMEPLGYHFRWWLTRPHEDLRDALNTVMLANVRIALHDLPPDVTRVGYRLRALVPVKRGD